MNTALPIRPLAAFAAAILLHAGPGLAQPLDAGASAAGNAAGSIADFFSQMGDQIYENCIFELSQEQIEVQQALVDAYTQQGASSLAARQLAVKQIEPPKLSEKCERIKSASQSQAAPKGWDTSIAVPKKAPVPAIAALPKAPVEPLTISTKLTEKKVLPQWDCAPGVDYVTIRHKGFERKLTGGEICSPFEDVVRVLPASAKSFRLGYTIRTGRLFVISDDAKIAGKTISWAISGREACRNNPDPDCFAARAVGPLPPGEYAFSTEKGQRVSWGPNAKRMVAGIYLTKLWNRERFSPAHTAAIMKRGNIAIHVRLKGEMSEACLGLGPHGWDYVSQLIKEGRATGVNVYIDEPFPQVAEQAPIVTNSSFSLSSLFN